MDNTKASKEIMNLFINVVNKYNTVERRAGSKHNLFHSERHMLDKIGDNPGVNITEFARAIGVTKGAVSQIVKKLENKGFIRRFKSSTNDKEVFLEITTTGRDIYNMHKRVNEETIKPLIEELNKHSGDEIEFLIYMFKWIGDFLDQSEREMKGY